jgi:integrase
LLSGYNPFVRGDEDIMKMPIHYTIQEAFEKMLEIKLPTLRKRAKETYNYMVNQFIDWLKQNKLQYIPVGQFDNAMASQYMDYLIVQRKLSGRTHNDRLIVQKVFFNEMIEREWIHKNPFRKIKPKPVEIGRNLAYTEKEREKLKKYLYDNDREMYYFSQIIYYCFIRRSELSQLRIEHFDLVNKTINIPADISKNKCSESVVIPVGLDSILEEMDLKLYPSNMLLFGRRLKRGYDQIKNVNHISSRHNKIVKDLKIDPEKGLYSWKHTGVCVAYYATGKDIYSVMRQLRHRDLNTTMIYLKSLGLIQNDVFRTSMVA